MATAFVIEGEDLFEDRMNTKMFQNEYSRYLTAVNDNNCRIFNIAYKRHGGMRFLKIGRLSLSWCIAREVRPLK